MGLIERREYSLSRIFELVAAIIMILLTPKTEAGASPTEMLAASFRPKVSY